ncbi:MAG: hypothetical protein LDL33_00930 [Desulfomonile sp.]|nr:hypothetical protein [Desulfomonile sp.]
MPALRDLVEDAFGVECIATGLSITESGRTFSLQKTLDDEAVAIHLEKCRRWPDRSKRADGLFICLPANSQMFLIVLVELKGGSVEKALEQLTQSAEVLCRDSPATLSPHAGKLTLWLTDARSRAHEGQVLGVVVGRQGLPQEQRKRKAARMAQKLIIRMRTTRRLSTTIDDLISWANIRK